MTDKITQRQMMYPPGSTVKVWKGALTGSPGIRPDNPECWICRIDHWNTIGQAYVVLNAPYLTGSGNCGMYISGAAIVEEA